MRSLWPSLILLGLLALARIPAAWAVPDGDEPLPTDPRMIEASALLSDEGQYDRVIGLYREVLRDEPDQISARLWLARVLSWRGDHVQSLAEYRRLLALDPVPRTAEIERAEVLSWAGSYDQALSAFGRLLKTNPYDARAARGIARTYSWSQRRGEAVKAYERALLLEDDTEAQRELERLRTGLGAGSDSRSRHLRDSDGFRLTSVTSNGTVDLGFDTRLLLSGSYTQVSDGRSRPGPSQSAGASGRIGLEQRLSRNLQARVEVGYRWWEQASGHVLGRGVLEYTLPSNTVLGLESEHSDFLSRSDSFQAVLDGLDQTSLLARAWQGLPRGWSAYAQLESSFVSDANRRIALMAGTELRPLPQIDLTLGLSFDYLTYTERSESYYDPSADLSAGLSLNASHTFFDWLRLSVAGTLGMGYAAEAGTTGFGVNYSISGGPEILYQGISLSLSATRSQSQRASVYTTHSFGLSLGMEF